MTAPDDDDFGFAPPPFKPGDALVGLKRQLRDLKLTERGTGFELKGRAVVDLKAGADGIEARLVKRPALTPEWTTQTLKSAAEVRSFVDNVKRQLSRWAQED